MGTQLSSPILSLPPLTCYKHFYPEQVMETWKEKEEGKTNLARIS